MIRGLKAALLAPDWDDQGAKPPNAVAIRGRIVDADIAQLYLGKLKPLVEQTAKRMGIEIVDSQISFSPSWSHEYDPTGEYVISIQIPHDFYTRDKFWTKVCDQIERLRKTLPMEKQNTLDDIFVEILRG